MEELNPDKYSLQSFITSREKSIITNVKNVEPTPISNLNQHQIWSRSLHQNEQYGENEILKDIREDNSQREPLYVFIFFFYGATFSNVDYLLTGFSSRPLAIFTNYCRRCIQYTYFLLFLKKYTIFKCLLESISTFRE